MNKLKLFVIWLDGYMTACGQVLNEEQTKVVQDKLNGLFEHEADKTEALKQTLDELGEEHGFEVKPSFPHGLNRRDEDGVVYRC